MSLLRTFVTYLVFVIVAICHYFLVGNRCPRGSKTIPIDSVNKTYVGILSVS